MNGDTLLALFAHPDDESLLAGGILAAAAAAGMEVVIVSVTGGELGGAAGQSGTLRARELEVAGKQLGARTAYCLDLPDGGVDTDPERLTAVVAELCERWHPNALLTFALDGWYWHRDHMAIHFAVMSTVPHAAPTTSTYVTTWPRHRMTRLARAARHNGASDGLWGLNPAAFGSAPSTFHFVVDVAAFLPNKTAAIAAHASEAKRGGLLTALPPAVAQPYLGTEFLSLAHAGDFDLPERLRRGGAKVRDRRRAAPAAAVVRTS